MQSNTVFPSVSARDLQGLDVTLPGAFRGKRNVVVIAFRRHHQTLVDSWVPWLEEHAAKDPDLHFYELPTIGLIWIPMRTFIDGGMAASIREPTILQRTFTVYGDVRRVTRPLGIEDRSTIALILVDRSGVVRWSGAGGFNPDVAQELERALCES